MDVKDSRNFREEIISMLTTAGYDIRSVGDEFIKIVFDRIQ